jgi:hypothetical protein
VPDLITIIEEDSGEAITTQHLRYGFRVIGGPRHFNCDVNYVPVEELSGSRV